MYESPINVIYGKITDQVLKEKDETMMLEIRQAIGYAVDKDELIKALQYDRHQYEKGYSDAVANLQKTGRWIDEWVGCCICLNRCSNCLQDFTMESKYCPNCGAKMEVEEYE